MPTKMPREDPNPAESLINLASRIPIRYQDYGSASRRNIYRSTKPLAGLLAQKNYFNEVKHDAIMRQPKAVQ
jgi:hypothetical protein